MLSMWARASDMKLYARFLNWLRPFVDKLMEDIKSDPEVSYDEYRKVKEQYDAMFGKKQSLNK